METRPRNAPTARKPRFSRIATALLVGIMIVAAGAVEAKDGGGGGKGGGGKGGGGGDKGNVSDPFYGHGEIIRQLIKFSDEPQPRRMGGTDDDNYLSGPIYHRVSPGIRHAGNRDDYCRTKYRSYDPDTGKYTGYSGRQHFCVVP